MSDIAQLWSKDSQKEYISCQKCAKKRFIEHRLLRFLITDCADYYGLQAAEVINSWVPAYWVPVYNIHGFGDFGEKRRDNSFILLDFGGREHIIILSSLMELNNQGRKYVGVSENNKTVFL